MERDKDEMERLTEMLNDPNAEFGEDEGEEEAMETEDTDLIQNEVAEEQKESAPSAEERPPPAEEVTAEVTAEVTTEATADSKMEE